MKLISLYHIVRLVGYLSGLTGMVLWFVGRSGENRESLQSVGAVLLLFMFVCLTGAYVFYMVAPRGRSGAGTGRASRRRYRTR